MPTATGGTTWALAFSLAVPLNGLAAAGFGGPDSVENRLTEDSRKAPAVIDERALDPWFEWKAGVARDTGLSFGLDYSSLYLNASESPGYSTASAGMGRFFGSWEMLGRATANSGALVWKVENRHRYGSVPPGSFAISELGYAGITGAPWSNQGTRLTNLYWRQRLADGQATVVAGWLDATDYADTFIGASPWTGFKNLTFSTGSASMFLPNDATLGAAAGAMLGDKLYAVAGITNAYSDPTSPFKDAFDRFSSDSEHFISLEFGWTQSQQRIYQDNYHLTLWHVDDSPDAGAVEGQGVAFSFVRRLDSRFTPFVRGGFANDGGSLLERSVSVGTLYDHAEGGHQLGIGLNWGRPNESTFGPGLDDQVTVEAFYRLNLTAQFALTPSLEYIDSPALAPKQKSTWVLGLRARLAL